MAIPASPSVKCTKHKDNTFYYCKLSVMHITSPRHRLIWLYCASEIILGGGLSSVPSSVSINRPPLNVKLSRCNSPSL